MGRDGGRVIDARPPRNTSTDVPRRHIDDIPIAWDWIAQELGAGSTNWNDGRLDA